tara:strand:- start:45 stop:545 length:501 start_codon:yes stop_codon:yes gene_type:complete
MGIPIAMPTNMQVIVKPGRFEVGSIPKVDRSSAKAGKSMSIDSAIALVNSAANAINSLSSFGRTGVVTLRGQRLVDRLFELLKKGCDLRDHEGKRLGHQQRTYFRSSINPKVGVKEPSPTERSGAAASDNAVLVDLKGESPRLWHPTHKFEISAQVMVNRGDRRYA